ncbi:MAG: type II toxin-antitoxin system RelB/DinJ family antitoxin [Bacteroidota bacterium]
MNKTATISARIDPDTKREAESVFRDLGLSASQAITLFYRQVQLRRGLPFEVKMPNETTRKALREAEARDGLASFDSTDALFDDLGL